MDLTVCGQISECRATVQRLKRNALCELESQEDMDAQCLGSRNEDELRDEINLSFRGQIIDNVGQRSPLSTVTDTNEDCLNREQVVDNVGQQPSRLLLNDKYERNKDLISFNEVCLGRIIDNVGQRSPRLSPELNRTTNENILNIMGQIVDNVGQRSLLCCPQNLIAKQMRIS